MAGNFYAVSGAAIDIQRAIDQAQTAGGGDVYIPDSVGTTPDGKWHWNGQYIIVPNGVNLLTSSPAGCAGHEENWAHYTPKCIIHSDTAIVQQLIWMDTLSGGQAPRISGIQFEAVALPPNGDDNNNGLAIGASGTDFRIDHCTFINFIQMAVYIDTPSSTSVTRGVIDHCVIDNPYKQQAGYWLWGYGFYGGNAYFSVSDWNTNIANFAGKYENTPPKTVVVYVEDCDLSRCRHSTDGINGAWIVTRYCLVQNSVPPYGDIEIHGSASWVSARGMEAYENTIIETPDDDDNYGNADIGARVRDGSALIFNNRFRVTRNTPSAYFLYLDDDNAGGDKPITRGNHIYVWGNVVENASFINNRGGYVENVDYFLRAPTQVQDGFTYTPYPYPHPLVGATPTCPTGYHWDEATQSCVLDTPSTVTPYSAILTAGATYRVTVPAQVTSGGQTYNFQQWNDGDTNPVKTVVLTADTTLTATYAVAAPTTVTLNVVAGANGTVSPSGPQTLTIGQTYQFTATPNANYLLDYWDLNGVNQGSTNPLSLLATAGMNGQTLTAHFKIQTITLNVSAAANGSVSPSGAQTLNVAQIYTFTATPNTYYNFDHWELNGVNISSASSLSLTIATDMNGKTLTAYFKVQTITLNVVSGGNGTVSPSGASLLTVGQTYQFTANPNTGYALDYWDLNGTNLGASNPLSLTTTSDMNGKQLTARFKLTLITLTASAGANGSVSPTGSQTLTIGNTYSFAALPNSGYLFDHWTLGTSNLGSSNPLNITAIADMDGKTLTALFSAIPPVQIQFTVAANISQGNVNPSPGLQTFNVGSIVQFTATALQGYAFKQWTMDGTIYLNNPLNLTITSDMAGKTLTAEFVKTQVIVQAVAGANGSMAPSGSLILIMGQSYQFAAVPDSGYNFDHWDLGGENKGSTNPLQLTATVDMDGKTLTALFSAIPPITVNVIVAVVGNGTTDLTPGSHEFHVGDTITIVAIPSAGTAFKQWQLDGLTYTDNPLSLPVTEALNGQTLTAEFISLTPQAASLLIPTVAVITLIGIGAAYSLSKKKGGR